MRLLLLLLLLGPCALRAAEYKPNTLTPKEIAQGWILLFDGETTIGWKAEAGFTVEEGSLRLSGVKGEGAKLSSTSAWDLCELKFDCAVIGKLGFDFHFPARSTEGTRTDQWCTLHYVLNERNGLVTSQLDTGLSIGPLNIVKGPAPSQHAIRFALKNNDIALIRNIKLRPSGTKSLFNGKDFTGW